MRTAPALLVALALAGCGTTVARSPLPPPRPRLATPPPQVTNGPRYVDAQALPLGVLLADTSDPVRIRFGRPPRSGLLFDLDSGEVLWRQDPLRVLPIASLTKMMTALLVADAAAPDERVRITRESLKYDGSGIGVLPRGKRVKLETLLNGLLLVSGNDAAIALAQHIDGTVDEFVAQMNARAATMRLDCTRFASPSGIVDAGNHSCAADLAAVARAVLDEPRLARIVRRRRAALPFPIKGGRLHLNNTNPLVRRGYRGAVGVKTGFTDAAGRCLVAAVSRRGRRLGVVLLHSPDPAGQAIKLLDRGFAL